LSSEIILVVDQYLLKAVAAISGINERMVLFRFNDEALALSDKLMSKDFKINCIIKSFALDNLPLKIKVKAKYDGFGGKKVGDIYCTFGVGKGKEIAYSASELAAEAAEAILLRGEQ
jgi:hypothetical protein